MNGFCLKLPHPSVGLSNGEDVNSSFCGVSTIETNELFVEFVRDDRFDLEIPGRGGTVNVCDVDVVVRRGGGGGGAFFDDGILRRRAVGGGSAFCAR